MFLTDYFSVELIAAAAGWFSAQIAKVFVNLATHKKNTQNVIFASGGMPSSHSATVCALASSTALDCGLKSPLFAITFILAFIVMYDAMNVRRETGDQGKLLNDMIEMFKDIGQPINTDKVFKELVGHTPLQVVVGGSLGIVIGLLVACFC